MKANFKKLYRALDKQRKLQGRSWRQFGAAVGVAPCTFTRLKQGKRIGVDNLSKLLPQTDLVSLSQLMVD
jgi:hypothetical protein